MSSAALIPHPATRSRLCTCGVPCPPTPTNPMRTVSMGGAARNRSGAGPGLGRGWARAEDEAVLVAGAPAAVPPNAARPSPPAISFSASRRSRSSLFAVMSTSRGTIHVGQLVLQQHQRVFGEAHAIRSAGLPPIRGAKMVAVLPFEGRIAPHQHPRDTPRHGVALDAGEQCPGPPQRVRDSLDAGLGERRTLPPGFRQLDAGSETPAEHSPPRRRAQALVVAESQHLPV